MAHAQSEVSICSFCHEEVRWLSSARHHSESGFSSKHRHLSWGYFWSQSLPVCLPLLFTAWTHHPCSHGRIQRPSSMLQRLLISCWPHLTYFSICLSISPLCLPQKVSLDAWDLVNVQWQSNSINKYANFLAYRRDPINSCWIKSYPNTGIYVIALLFLSEQVHWGHMRTTIAQSISYSVDT